MKKIIIFSLAFLMVLGALSSCGGGARVEEVTPPPPPPPEVEEQPEVETVEKVEEPVVVKEPELTEEEIFMSKTLEEINLEAPLQMIHFDYDKYFIRDDAKFVLEANADWLKKYDALAGLGCSNLYPLMKKIKSDYFLRQVPDDSNDPTLNLNIVWLNIYRLHLGICWLKSDAVWLGINFFQCSLLFSLKPYCCHLPILHHIHILH